ncbi:20249_t:CDS:1, partial [Racocetra persica]
KLELSKSKLTETPNTLQYQLSQQLLPLPYSQPFAEYSAKSTLT